MAYQYTVTPQDTGGLNSIAARFGFSNYKDAGVTSVPSGNFDQIKPGDVINFGNYNGPTGGGNSNAGTNTNTQTPAVPNKPAGAPQTPDLHALINGNQDSTIASSLNSDVPTKDTTTPPPDNFSDLQSALAGLPPPPTPTSQADQYNTLADKYGVNDLETRLNSLNAETASLQNSKESSVNAELYDKPVAMNVINGRVSEQDRSFNDKINQNNLQATEVSNQLKGAYTTIDSIMKYNQQDYDNATKAYDTKFQQAISLYDANNKQQDTARANLSILYNSIKDGGVNLSNADDATKLSIAKMELQAGLPVGFYSLLQSTNPKADILWTGTTNTANGKYAQVMTQDPTTGARSIQSYYLGQETGTAGDSVSQKNDIAEAVLNFQNAMKPTAQGGKGFKGADPGEYQFYKDYLQNTYGAAAALALDTAMQDNNITVDNGQ